ncbi:MAG: ABC transporter substrate-binding protein [Dethiobacteraceae bacterium]|jgi:iron complex transport system substrate-binding protein|nr:ABC transporter substrate-binding protein [Bacillota bacterium]
MWQKTAAALLAVLLAFTTACANIPQANDVNPARTVTDQAGRQVALPEEVETVAMMFSIPTSLLLALGVGDRLLAVGATWGIQTLIEPSLETVGTVGRGHLDREALAAYKPDVFIHKASDPATLEAVETMGIPAVGITTETPEEVLAAITLLGEVFNRQDRAAELVAYYQSKIELANSIAAQIPAEERKTAIVMGSEIGKVAGGNMLQSFMIETAGGINCAKEVESQQPWPVVGTEKIFAWNPDFIFCTNGSASEYEPADLLNDPNWQNITAVKNKKVLLVPTDKDSWEYPSLSTCLGFLWMLCQMYPEYYSEAEFLQEVDLFYETAYGMTFALDFLGYEQ